MAKYVCGMRKDKSSKSGASSTLVVFESKSMLDDWLRRENLNLSFDLGGGIRYSIKRSTTEFKQCFPRVKYPDKVTDSDLEHLIEPSLKQLKDFA